MLTTRFVTGAPDWIEVGVADPDGAASFYRALFGWRFRPGAGPADGGLFEREGAVVAGGRRTAQATTAEPSAWTVYFRSPDPEAAAEISRRSRGEVLRAAARDAEGAVTALLRDRTGAVFGVRRPGRRAGVEAAGVPGALCWTELYTADVAAAAAYYRAVLGLDTSGVTFPGGVYTCVEPGGAEEEAMFGGLAALADDPVETVPRWLPYFAVPDTDAVVARTLELGGEVPLPATDVEGVGRLARLADPWGARFAVLTPAPRQA
ncbi:VOC family protein [Streptomyces tagetis]|uniref:VOC family protein n=1 Tax=Streptomyces tagetis TaxID=2820809 RepID=A0A941AZR8_9ACTN|nr:VOC family protein [Streptomyces sp. RG38]MBQ0825776.1 VOC family protein [Streptomyces sp. RG38]